MKEYKTTIIAIIVLIAAIIAFVVIKNVNEKSTDNPEATEAPMEDLTVSICSFSPYNVTKLTVHNEEEITVIRLSEDSWTCTTHPDLEIYDTAMYDILTVFGNLNGLLLLDGADEEINYGKYGLAEEDNPSWAKVLLKDGKTYTVYLGVNNLSGSKTYIRVEGQDKVFTISSTYSDDLLATRASFIYLYPFKFGDNDKINLIQMYKGKDIRFSAVADFSTEEKGWNLSKPVPRPGEASNINTLVNSLTAIKLSQIIETDCGDLSKYGLDVPDTKYILSDTTGVTKSVSIGNKTADESSFYCVFNDGNDIYTVSTSFFNYKDTDLLQFMNVYPFLEQYTNLSHVDIYINDSIGEVTYTMDIGITETTVKDEEGNPVKDITGEYKYEEVEELKFNGKVLKDEETIDLFRKFTTSIYMVKMTALELEQGEVGKTILKIEYTRTDGSKVVVECKERSEDTMYVYCDGEYIGGYCKVSRVSEVNMEYSIRNSANALLEQMEK